MLRLFSALQIPQKTTEALVSIQNGLKKAQWINPQNFHITLSFFGEIDSSIEERIIHAFNTIKCPPFMLSSEGFEVFGSKNAPHSLVIRITSCEALSLLHEKIQHTRDCLGLTPDKTPFTPHITLARLLDIQPDDLPSYLASRGDFAVPSFEVNHFVLLSSENPLNDTPYIVKGSWPLQA
ncbi:RNA 2',3'-cyclic phosphodiesterase [Bartonella sp. A05]|uniref:RNA 2',3'-cyclic phosphodiesterase n=1 Tax=Bartonella sp. A05 TaxID=2967261 RepID=UPI0022A99EB4|nr:RNA 2',3'-cyclic phosphodiesterase [Bartonella sp. A05]MCZ2203468.1 RNA 2',3'-cyclic phosphodiesterase [Bartonella sp. A05]